MPRFAGSLGPRAGRGSRWTSLPRRKKFTESGSELLRPDEPPEMEIACLEEWIGYRNKCYFISDGEENWTSSQTFCAERESLLVVFENKDEMCSLAKVLKIDDSWIGLRKTSEGFYWENGVALEDSFQIQNHSECAYLDGFTISTSACSLPRRCICMRSLKG
ncbi:C-type lectin domain family 2 member F-like [Aegotheles albertisi]